MQITVYFREEDRYLIDKIDRKAKQQRKSRSSLVLTALEEYFESQKRVGEILKDFGALDHDQLTSALSSQREGEADKKLGQILLEEDYVEEVDLERALTVQEGRINLSGS